MGTGRGSALAVVCALGALAGCGVSKSDVQAEVKAGVMPVEQRLAGLETRVREVEGMKGDVARVESGLKKLEASLGEAGKTLKTISEGLMQLVDAQVTALQNQLTEAKNLRKALEGGATK